VSFVELQRQKPTGALVPIGQALKRPVKMRQKRV